MSANTKQSVAKALLDIDAVGFSPDAPIIFKSGIRSPVYVDNRALIFHPPAWHIVVEGFTSRLVADGISFDIIAGVAVGGVPHSSALAYILQKPAIFVRKEEKAHGKGQRIEGGDVRGKRVLLVEDLITTGGSSLSAVDALRIAGARVADVAAIISYGFSAASAAFDAAGLRLHTLTDFAAVLTEAQRRGALDDAQLAVARRWFADPYNWEIEAIPGK